MYKNVFLTIAFNYSLHFKVNSMNINQRVEELTLDIKLINS
jgi:hypothetical protein